MRNEDRIERSECVTVRMTHERDASASRIASG